MPLAVIEAYFRVEVARLAMGRYIVAALILMLVLATGYGTYRAAVGMWLPAVVGSRCLLPIVNVEKAKLIPFLHGRDCPSGPGVDRGCS